MFNSEEKIAFIGAGNMAGSIIRGLIHQSYSPTHIWASAPSPKNLTPLKTQFDIHTTHNNNECIDSANIVVLGVKPQMMQNVCENIGEALNPSALIISLAAGVTCEKINHWLGGEYAVVRCMSNTPAQVSLGASGLYANKLVTSEQKTQTQAILSAVGIACWVEHESLIDTVTALAGSGPAYFFLFIEAMIEAAIEQGMSKDVAQELTIQTALGAAKLAQLSDDNVIELRRKVTSPKGTTERAIASFEKNHIRATVQNAMDACTQRAKELANDN